MADSACDHSLARASLSRGPPFFFFHQPVTPRRALPFQLEGSETFARASSSFQLGFNAESAGSGRRGKVAGEAGCHAVALGGVAGGTLGVTGW